MANQTDLEKVRMYWDFKETLLNSMIVVTFALIGTAGILMNTLSQNPTLWWTVYIWAPVFLLILVYAVSRSLDTLMKLGGEADRYLKMVDAGEKIPDLPELMRKKAPS